SAARATPAESSTVRSVNLISHIVYQDVGMIESARMLERGQSRLSRSAMIALTCILFAHKAGSQPLTTRALVDKYCVTCHSQKLKTGGIALEGLDTARVGENAGAWERVLRKVRGGQVPPAGLAHPDSASAKAAVAGLEEALDKAAAAHPDAGAPLPHRLNR